MAGKFPYLKIVGAICVGTVLTEVIYHLIHKLNLRKRKSLQGKGGNVMKTIFFPDPQVACKEHFTSRHGCTNQRCGFSHDLDNSYGQMLRFLSDTRVKMDICVFVLTCADFGDILIDLHKKGVVIRVVTDGEQVSASGSQINRLRAEGIQVRNNTSSYHMHHKFAIVDGTKLLNGSFNWTRQAITGNHENLFITENTRLLKPYQQEFDKLWNEFNPSSR